MTIDEVIEECAKIAESGAKDCCEGDGEWHRGFRYAARNTALQIASRIRALNRQCPPEFEPDDQNNPVIKPPLGRGVWSAPNGLKWWDEE